MNRIIGLDVGRGSAVLCCLNDLPSNIQQHYKKLVRDRQFYKVDCSRAGVEKLLSLSPTGIVIEPTGHWYSQFWVTVAKKYNIPVYCDRYQELRKSVKGKDSLVRILFKATRMLFYQLVNEINDKIS